MSEKQKFVSLIMNHPGAAQAGENLASKTLSVHIHRKMHPLLGRLLQIGDNILTGTLLSDDGQTTFPSYPALCENYTVRG